MWDRYIPIACQLTVLASALYLCCVYASAVTRGGKLIVLVHRYGQKNYTIMFLHVKLLYCNAAPAFLCAGETTVRQSRQM